MAHGVYNNNALIEFEIDFYGPFATATAEDDYHVWYNSVRNKSVDDVLTLYAKRNERVPPGRQAAPLIFACQLNNLSYVTPLGMAIYLRRVEMVEALLGVLPPEELAQPCAYILNIKNKGVKISGKWFRCIWHPLAFAVWSATELIESYQQVIPKDIDQKERAYEMTGMILTAGASAYCGFLLDAKKLSLMQLDATPRIKDLLESWAADHPPPEGGVEHVEGLSKNEKCNVQ
jgi:hypothetical protein